MEHARGIPNATGVHRHVDDLLLDLGGVIGIAVIQQESAPVAYRLLATRALLALAGLPMSDDSCSDCDTGNCYTITRVLTTPHTPATSSATLTPADAGPPL